MCMVVKREELGGGENWNRKILENISKYHVTKLTKRIFYVDVK